MTTESFDLATIQSLCHNLTFGKRLPTALYLHVSTFKQLPNELREYEAIARALLPTLDLPFSLIKLNTNEPKISYLDYPDFDNDPHPALKQSIQVNLELANFQQRNYGDNPPILHRKETFVHPSYPLYETFRQLTRAEEKIGLLRHVSTFCSRA